MVRARSRSAERRRPRAGALGLRARCDGRRDGGSGRHRARRDARHDLQSRRQDRHGASLHRRAGREVPRGRSRRAPPRPRFVRRLRTGRGAANRARPSSSRTAAAAHARPRRSRAKYSTRTSPRRAMSLASLEWGRTSGTGRKSRGLGGLVIDVPLLVILLLIVGIGIRGALQRARGRRGLARAPRVAVRRSASPRSSSSRRFRRAICASGRRGCSSSASDCCSS